MHGKKGRLVDILEGMALMERGTLDSGYYLVGERQFWAKRWLDGVRRRFLGEGWADGYVTLEAVAQWGELDLALRTTGFFSQRRIVVAKDAAWPKREDSLQAYLSHADPEALLIIWDKKGSAALSKIFGPHRQIDLKPLAPAVFRKFVGQEAKKRQVRLTPDGVEMLGEMMTHEEQQILYELDKMALYDPTRTWDEQAVGEFSSPLPHDTQLWRLTDPLAQRQGPQVLKQAQDLLKEGKAPLLIFIVAVRHLIQLNRALAARRQGQSLQDFAGQEGLKEFPAKKLWQYSQYWSPEDLSKLLERAAFIDRALKTGYGDPETWVVSYLALLERS